MLVEVIVVVQVVLLYLTTSWWTLLYRAEYGQSGIVTLVHDEKSLIVSMNAFNPPIRQSAIDLFCSKFFSIDFLVIAHAVRCLC